MFLDFFDWFCSCLTSVFEVMKKFVLFGDFTFYHLAIALLAIPIIFKIIHFIMGIEDEEPQFEYLNSSRTISQYDSNSWNRYNNKSITFGNYKPKHRASYRFEYVPKHEYKGRHGKL